MGIRVSTMIHARTKDVDFRSKLLVVPENFGEEEIQWARTYITDSTRYFELVNEDGRRVIFCNDKYIVIGISIYIKDLYEKCGRESKYSYVDGRRSNYAFIGLVMLKRDLDSAIHVPYAAFLEEYEKYMALRWDDSPNSSRSLENTRVGYREMEVKKADKIYHETIVPGKDKVILPGDPALLENITDRVMTTMMTKGKLAFCSNMPNAASVKESHFDIVTSPRADAIIASIRKNREDSRGNDSENVNKRLAGEQLRDKQPVNKEVNGRRPEARRKAAGAFDVLLIFGTVFGTVLALGMILIKGNALLSSIAGICAMLFGGLEIIRRTK